MPWLRAQADESLSPVPVRVQLKWLHQFQFAGYYAAVEKGFYARRGLEVELIEGRPELDPAKFVLAGGAEYGVGTPEILLDYAKGEPLVALGVVFQHSPYVFLAMLDSGISDVSQLAGKRIMMEPQAAELYAYLAREQVPMESLVVLPHSFSAHDLLDGTVDAISAYATDEEFTLARENVPYSTFSPRSGGVDFYGDLFFTTQSELRQHPERVRAFYEATIEGWQYALDHPEEMVDLILEKYQSRKSREALLFEADKMRQLMHPEIIPVGYMYAGRWQHIAETYQELGMLQRLPRLEPFLYNPNPSTDYTWALWTSGVMLAVALVAFGILLPVWRLNVRLRREVEIRRRTEAELYETKVVAERANQVKAQFLASVTHDLRTPLNAILGLSEVMLDSEQDREKREHLEHINSAGDSLLLLIDDLLDLNRIESGRMELRDDAFALDDVFDQVANLLFIPAHRKGLALTASLESADCASLRGDPERLRQILFNLGGNAIKFTDEGFVNLRAGKDAKGWLCLSVEDSGPGISKEIRERLFEPFVRAPQAKLREGSGLGLSIVKKVTEAMGGSVEVDTGASGKGTCFRIHLPIINDMPGGPVQALGESLRGLRIGVSLEGGQREAAVIRNLESLGAEAGDVGHPPAEGWDLMLLDPGRAASAGATAGLLAATPCLILKPSRSLITRRTLARLVRIRLSLASPDEAADE